MGCPGEKVDLSPPRINHLRLNRTGSDGAKRFRFPVVLICCPSAVWEQAYASEHGKPNHSRARLPDKKGTK